MVRTVNEDLPDAAREVLTRVAEYREAARRAVHADRPLRTKCLALLSLGTLGATEPDATVRPWVESAIWREAAPFLTKRPASPSGDAYERAVRHLLSRGYVSCPSCRTPLPSEQTLDRWRLIRAEGMADG